MYKTEQEDFWAGDFGNEYIERNNSAEQLASNITFFSDVFKHCDNINSIVEFGANIGMNIRAIKQLLPSSRMTGIEINKNACKALSKIDDVKVINDSILNVELKQKFDFVFIKGVLIHINPNELQNVYSRLYEATKVDGYIMIAEYYNPTPVSVVYRGRKNKLFKRDFPGELMDKYSDLKLIDYGFTYYRKSYNGDTNWFLMRKTARSNV